MATKTKKSGNGTALEPSDAAVAAIRTAGEKESALAQMGEKVAQLRNEVLAVTRVDTDEQAADIGAKGRQAADIAAAFKNDRMAITRPIRAAIDLLNGNFAKVEDPANETAAHARKVIGEHKDRQREEAEKARFRAQTKLDIEAADLDMLTRGRISVLAMGWEAKLSAKTADAWETESAARVRERIKDLQKALKKHEKAVEKAETKGETPPPPPPQAAAPAMTVAAPVVSGRVGGTTKTQLRWVWSITNREEIPDKWWIVDEAAIEKAVTHGGVREIPGVEIKQKSRTNL